jgi:hypothetical protein
MTFEEAIGHIQSGKTLVLRGWGCHDYFKQESKQQGFKIICTGFLGGFELVDHPEYDTYSEWWEEQVGPYLDRMTLSILGEE